jgi:hypothetical protein
MATRNLVPRNSGEGGVGRIGKSWATGVFDNLIIGNQPILTDQELLSTSNVQFSSGNFDQGLTVNGIEVAKVTGEIEKIIQDISEFAFFSDAFSHNSITEKVFYATPNPNIYLSGVSVANARDMHVSVEWDGPSDDYCGTAFIQGQQIPIENISHLGNSSRRFRGYIDHINLEGEQNITATINSKNITLPIIEVGDGPIPTNITIDSIENATPKPGHILGETHLKEGDKINAFIDFDSPDVKFIKIHEHGLSHEVDFTSYTLSGIANNTYRATVPITVSNREGDLSIAVQAINHFGTTGELRESLDFFHESGSIPVDQTYPIISGSNPTGYNGRTDGLRLQEFTYFSNDILNWDSEIDQVEYIQIPLDNIEISIDKPNTYESNKMVTCINGAFNNQPNVKILATKKSNGASSSADFTINIANPPSIVSSNLSRLATFSTPPHKIGESQVKHGDLIELNIVINDNDESSEDLEVSILDQGASDGSQVDFSDSYSQTINESGYTNLIVPIKVFGPISNASRDGEQPIYFQIKNSNGVTSDSHLSSGTVELNNGAYPSISIHSISYPENQQAIKSGEHSVVLNTASNFDEIEYSSLNESLTIESSSTYEPAKNAHYLSGDYNIKNDGGSNNIKISALKLSNGTVSEISDTVNIANKPLDIFILGLDKLISHGGEPTDSSFTDISWFLYLEENNTYDFDLNSSQKMLEPPTLYLNPNQTNKPILTHKTESSETIGNSFSIKVADENTKGSFAWLVSAKNLANIETTGVTLMPNYIMEGFSARLISSHPTSLSAGIASIGTNVSNPNNIIFENLSEGGTEENGGTKYEFLNLQEGTLLNSFMDYDNKFTICNSSGIVNYSGDHVFNLDKTNRSANTSTSSPAQFIIQEL